MWDPESTKEEWARRKTYLIRNLFEDKPKLSTILEEDESRLQISPSISDKPLLPQRLNTRRLSPLPELIIEIIPRRPKQDEPEEFYISLEKEMKRLYKRDYLNIYSSCSSEGVESESNLETSNDILNYALHGDCGNLCLAISKDGEDHFLEAEESEYDKSNETNERRLSQTFTIVNIESTSDNIDSREDISPRPSIEKEIGNVVRDSTHKEESIKSNKLQHESSKTFIPPPTTGFGENNKTSDEDESEVIEREESEKLAEKSGASSFNTDLSMSIPEPDEIRGLEKRVSFISLPDRYSERFQEDSWEFKNKRLSIIDQDISDEVIASGRDTQISEESAFDISAINVTSTPKSIRKVNKNRYEPYLHISSGSKKPNCNKALQTSFSDEENFPNLWRNFFVGTPKCFTLI